MYVDSRYSVRHTLSPGRSGERVAITSKQGRELSSPPTAGETTLINSLNSTLRIRQLIGFQFSSVIPISPLRPLLFCLNLESIFMKFRGPQALVDNLPNYKLPNSLTHLPNHKVTQWLHLIIGKLRVALRIVSFCRSVGFTNRNPYWNPWR